MPTVISHAAVPLAIAVIAGSKRVGGRLLIAGIAASMLPDLDVVSFRFGLDYDSDFGHRGFTHSLFFAVVAGGTAALLAPLLKTGRGTAFAVVALSCASHGLLDMLTNGGLGVAYFWPLASERYFWPYRPIEVSPLRAVRFLGPDGLRVAVSEIGWIWIPALAASLFGRLMRR